MDAHLELVLCAPELAVLSALEATLRASTTALIAAHAQLEAEDFAASPHPPSAQACLAAVLLTQLEALQPSTPPANPHFDRPSLDVRTHCPPPARCPSTSLRGSI